MGSLGGRNVSVGCPPVGCVGCPPVGCPPVGFVGCPPAVLLAVAPVGLLGPSAYFGQLSRLLGLLVQLAISAEYLRVSAFVLQFTACLSLSACPAHCPVSVVWLMISLIVFTCDSVSARLCVWPGEVFASSLTCVDCVCGCVVHAVFLACLCVWPG